MKENFQITDKDTGKTYWISRAIAVAGVVMCKVTNGGQWFFLLEKRGPGCPDNVGKWCGVCGYMNWGETRKEAMIRETYEETGYEANPENVIELETIDDPNRDARENVVTRYAIIADYNLFEYFSDDKINIDTKSRGGEEGEVSELTILNQTDIEQMNSDEFAFGHKEMILDIVEKMKGRNFNF